jgi:hypothetical protein
MGYMRHHGILVTSWHAQRLTEAHQQAVTLFEGLVSPVVEALTNGYRSFAILPDGSKEGWPESDGCDALRAEFVRYLESTRYADGSSDLDWVIVQFGDGERETCVVDDSDRRVRAGEFPELTGEDED